MKICFFANNYSFTGGLEKTLSLIASELSKENEIHVVSMYDISNDSIINYSKNVRTAVIFKGNKNYVKHLIPAICFLRKYLIDNKIEILIASTEFLGSYSYLATKKTKTKYICWTHSPALAFDESVIHRPIKHIAFQKADAIVSLTPESKEILEGKYPKKNIYSIANPVDPKLVNNNNYNAYSKKIISVGRICPQKNYKTLLEVAKIVLGNNEDWLWEIYGDGDANIKEELLKIISESNMDNKLILKGNVNNIYDLYKHYSMLVMTSKREGFPMVLLEGMANHLPLISFDISTGPNLIIKNGINGYLINPYNIEQMANKIQLLIDNRELRTRMSEANEPLINNYKIETITKQWQNMLKKESIE